MAKGRHDGTVSSAAAAMRTIAADGYLAYIEWPVFLAHRLKQVEQHLTVTATPEVADEPVAPVAATLVKAAMPQTDLGSYTGLKPLGGLAIAAAKKRVAPKAEPPVQGAESELMRLLEGFDMLSGEK